MAPHIAVVGAGAVGGFIGARLTAAGENVTLIDRWREHVDATRRNGLRIDGSAPQDNAIVPVRILADDEIESLKALPPLDIVFISVKSYDTRRAVELVLPYLHADAVVVSAQNGCNEATLTEIVGASRTAGLIAARIGVELSGPGVIRRRVIHGSPGIDVFRIGELDGQRSARIEALATLLRQVDSVAVIDNLAGERWSKLAVNAMRNGVRQPPAAAAFFHQGGGRSGARRATIRLFADRARCHSRRVVCRRRRRQCICIRGDRTAPD